jgi:HAD superfamily hydrolase (TIGR01490 family)
MSVALFDLDNTLLCGDSDYQWGRFLIDQGLVDRAVYERENQRFFENYQAGTLDIYAFSRFAYKPLAQHSLDVLQNLRERYIEQKIQPIILPKARELLAWHRQQGDLLVIITSTNRFVTEPIAELLGVSTLIATEPEFKDGRFTGELHGIPCFQQGKVDRLHLWLEAAGCSLKDSWFYSDSHNDIPLLEAVTYPVAVDADEKLKKVAFQRGWPMISLRNVDC